MDEESEKLLRELILKITKLQIRFLQQELSRKQKAGVQVSPTIGQNRAKRSEPVLLSARGEGREPLEAQSPAPGK